MIRAFAAALGNPEQFTIEFSKLASDFSSVAGVKQCDLNDIRNFVAAQNYQLTREPTLFRMSLAAFGSIIIHKHAQRLRVRGVFRKRILVESKGFRCDFLDLFYRCVFEGLDLTQDDEHELG
jgi:hypothetical protein